MTSKEHHPIHRGLTLVLGASGKTGRRVVKALERRGVPTRSGSRTATPSFDWANEAGWNACLQGVEAVYLNYAPDLAVPGAADSISAFMAKAKNHGVRRVAILSGRGESEAQACEQIVLRSGIPSTVVRASWFNQNFSEGAFVDMVRAGTLALPAGEVPEPFVDVDDIADVITASLTESGHEGEVYEVTGPRLITLSETAAELSRATARPVTYQAIPHEAFVGAVSASGAPEQVVWLMDYLFSTVLDGRNAHLTDGVERALGRPPRDFQDYATQTATSGVWQSH